MKTPLFDVISREAEHIKHNPAYRFMLFTGPLVGIFVLFFIFRQGSVRELPIAVVDQDHSSLSVKIENNLNASPDVAVQVHAHDLFSAKKLLEQGEIDAIVLIPDQTEENVYRGNEAPVPIYINGMNVLKAGLIQRSVLTTLKTMSGGVQYKKLLLGGKNSRDAMNRVVPVKMQKHVLFNPYNNYNYFLGSAMIYVMLFLFVFLSSVYSLGNELKFGTGLDLLNQSNNSVRIALAGKMIPYTVIFSGFAMLINYLLFSVDGMPVNGNFWIMFIGQFITIVSYQMLGLLFIGITSNLRLALSLASAYSIMGLTFSGLTFPLEAMPKLAFYFSAIFPFTWWERVVISQSFYGAPLKYTLPLICYILIFQLLSSFFLGTYKKHLSNPKYWGKS